MKNEENCGQEQSSHKTGFLVINKAIEDFRDDITFFTA
jgi:hypothetical protein